MKFFKDETYEGLPLLTKEEEVKLSKSIIKGTKKQSQKAIHTFVLSNLRLVTKIVNQHYSYFRDLEDLMSEGILGLYEAATRYDSKHGVKFSTYSAIYIHQFIMRYIERSNTIRLPSHARGKMNRIVRIREELEKELGYELSDEELSEHTGVNIDTIKLYSKERFNTISLDTPIANGESVETIASTIADTAAVCPGMAAGQESTSRLVSQTLASTLSARELDIIQRRFGFLNNDPMVLEDIGKVYSVSRERIRQIQDRAFRKLRKHLSATEISKS
jgi:RNA polymerase primary sigma factor